MLTCNGALANSNKARACEILQGCVEQETLLSILLYLDSLGCRSLHFACLFAASRLTNLYSTAELPKCDVVITITFDIPWSGPIVRINTHRRLFPPWRFPPPAGATHLAELYRQPGRPHQEGRGTRTPHATSGTVLVIVVQRYLQVGSGGHAREVRQVHGGGHENQEMHHVPCWTSRS